MNASAPIAPGSPQRPPTRAAPSLVRALRDAHGSPPWTPWTILYRLTGTNLLCNLSSVDGADRRDPHAGLPGRLTA